MGGGRGAGVEGMTISSQRLDPLAVRYTKQKKRTIRLVRIESFHDQYEIAGHAL